MILVEKIVPVARERLVTVKENALLTEAARFLDGGHINLVVVCDKGGAMVGIVTRTDVVRQMSICQGSGWHRRRWNGDDQGCYLLPDG
jgi:CBS domain-containing protein